MSAETPLRWLLLLWLLLISTPLMAEPLLYGSLSYQKEKRNTSPYTPFHPIEPTKKEQQGIRGTIGIEGAHPLGNGNALIYQFEWGNQNYKRPPTKELSPYQHP